MSNTTDDVALEWLRRALDGRYRLERLLGRGGMGAVYLARDVVLDRPVALKVLPQEFATVPDLRERFLRETRTAASFSHPNIVPVFSVEDRPGLLAFAMGFVEGESLADRVRRSGPLSVKELVRLLQDIGYALAYAHGREVVHRDIKPDNIMIERATGRALLMDFGISRTITVQAATPGLTRVGEVVGTPEFMSPEQAAGDTLNGRSDLHSLGLVAWFAATGTLAISGDSTQKILVRQITEVIPSVRTARADLPPALASVIDHCLVKDPDQRMASAEELVEALDAAQLSTPEVPLPIRLFAEEAGQAGLVLIGGLLMVVLLYVTAMRVFENDLDTISAVVLFLAVLWARLAQTFQAARRLARRGFGRDDVLRGLRMVLSERDAERAQLRADATVVARRRRQVTVLVGLLAFTVALRWYVTTYQRTQIGTDMYRVSRPGVIMLYSLYITRGMAIVGLVRSPLRRPLGEWLFRGFWLGPIGGAVLSLAARGTGVTTGLGTTIGPTSATAAGATMPPLRATPTAGAAVSRTPPAPAAVVRPVTDVPRADDPLTARLAHIEARLDRLEQGSPAPRA